MSDPCISPSEVAEFIGKNAVVETWTDDIYIGFVYIFPDSDTPVALYHDNDCCNQTLLNYCDIRSIS